MWKSHEIRRLIAQLAGIALGTAGVLMIVEELRATGVVGLFSSLSFGELSSESMGLFLLGLSLPLIALPALWGDQPIQGLRDPRRRFGIIATPGSLGRFVLIAAAGVALSLLFGGEFVALRNRSRIGVLPQLVGAVAGVVSGSMKERPDR